MSSDEIIYEDIEYLEDTPTKSYKDERNTKWNWTFENVKKLGRLLLWKVFKLKFIPLINKFLKKFNFFNK